MLKTPRAHQLCLRSWPITGNLSKMEFQERLYLLILARRSDFTYSRYGECWKAFNGWCEIRNADLRLTSPMVTHTTRRQTCRRPSHVSIRVHAPAISVFKVYRPADRSITNYLTIPNWHSQEQASSSSATHLVVAANLERLPSLHGSPFISYTRAVHNCLSAYRHSGAKRERVLGSLPRRRMLLDNTRYSSVTL